jgi:hypothetical protein
MGTFLCEDFWTGSEYFQNVIETRDIENEGDLTNINDEDSENLYPLVQEK